MNGNALDSRAKPRAKSPSPSRPLRLPFGGTLVVAALVCLLTSQTAARAQDLDDVTFSGVVSDQHGAVVVGATVTARLAGTGTVRAAVTDGAGRYRLVELPPGVYTLGAARAGFAAEERRGCGRFPPRRIAFLAEARVE